MYPGFQCTHDIFIFLQKSTHYTILGNQGTYVKQKQIRFSFKKNEVCSSFTKIMHILLISSDVVTYRHIEFNKASNPKNKIPVNTNFFPQQIVARKIQILWINWMDSFICKIRVDPLIECQSVWKVKLEYRAEIKQT